MNRNAYRLFAPGVAFGIVGVLVLWAGADGEYRLRGGLVAAGLYGLALQVVLSLLLVASIDDIGDGPEAQRTNFVGRPLVDQYNQRARNLNFSHALPRFYFELFVPMALLSFGLGITLSAIVDGALANRGFTEPGWHPSEIVLAGILVAGAGFLFIKGTVGSFCGWCLAFAFAAVRGQARYIEGTESGPTFRIWLQLAGGLCLTRLLYWAAVTGVRRLARRQRGPAIAG